MKFLISLFTGLSFLCGNVSFSQNDEVAKNSTYSKDFKLHYEELYLVPIGLAIISGGAHLYRKSKNPANYTYFSTSTSNYDKLKCTTTR